MAEDNEKYRVIHLETGEAKKSIADLRKEVKQYKDTLDSATIGSQEYKDALNGLNTAQVALGAAQKGAVNAVGELDNSYNGLSKRMRMLMDAQKQIDVSTKEGMAAFKESAKEINSINGQLKDLDATNGVFSRNVGDYANSFTSAFSAMGAGTSTLGKGLGGLKGMLDVLKAHPIIAIIAVVVGLIMKLVAAVKKNEESYNRLQKALAPIQGLMNILANAVDFVATKFVELTEKIMDFAGKLTGKFSGLMRKLGFEEFADKVDGVIAKVQEFTNAATDIAEKEAKLAKDSRNILVQNAKLERDIAELRAKSSDKENYNAQERLKYVKQAGELQRQVAENNLKLAEDEYKLLKLKADQVPNDKEANDKLAQAEAKRYQVQQQYYATIRSINKEYNKTSNEIENQTKALEQLDRTVSGKPIDKELERRLDAIEKEYDNYEKQYKKFKDDGYLTDEEYENKKKELAIKKAIETERARIQVANKEREKELSRQNTDDSMFIAELEYQAELRRIYTKRTAEEELEDERKLENDKFKIRIEGLQRYLDFYQLESTNMTLSEDERKEYVDKYNATLDQMELLRQEYNVRMAEFDQKEQEQMIGRIEQSMSLFESTIGELLSIGDGLSSEWSNVFKTLDAAILNTTKNIKNGERGWKLYGEMAVQALGVASSMLTALADEQDETNEEGFKKQKAYQISSAVMSMLAGITAAVSGLFTTKSGPWDIALAAIQATMIGAMGAAQIAKISQTKFGDSATGSTSVATPSINASAANASAQSVAYQNIMSNAQLEESIVNQKVYVVESDISNAQKRVKVVESESMY